MLGTEFANHVVSAGNTYAGTAGGATGFGSKRQGGKAPVSPMKVASKLPGMAKGGASTSEFAGGASEGAAASGGMLEGVMSGLAEAAPLALALM